jgi:transcriptional regulator GlxA family with amidase domain
MNINTAEKKKVIGFSEKVIQYILSRSDEQLGNLTVEKITRELNVSQSHLYQTFKTEKNVTPAKFLTMIKMFRSASLLERQKGLTVKIISRKMGFSNPDYFIKIFREHFGTTPGRYRGYTQLK